MMLRRFRAGLDKALFGAQILFAFTAFPLVLAHEVHPAVVQVAAAPHSGGDVAGFAWADGGMGYSLVGQAAVEALKPIANEVRRQARTI
jgi:hypothetical protein